MERRNLISALTISLVLLTANLKAEDLVSSSTSRAGLGFDLITTVGSQLDKLENKSSITFEPTAAYFFEGRRTLELYSAIDRPFNEYENLTVPKTILTFGQGLDLFQGTTSTLSIAATAVNLDRWSTDGRMLRGSVYLANQRELFRHFTAYLKVGPFIQGNEYRTNTAGRDLPKYGLTEKLILEYTLGPVVLDLVVLLEQKRSDIWKNGYSTLEQAAYRFDERWSLGISHELIGSTVDDSTGRFHSLQVLDERNSRVSAFVEYTL